MASKLASVGRNSFKMVKNTAGKGMGAGLKVGKLGAGLGVGLGKGLGKGLKGLATGDIGALDAKLAAMQEQMELSTGQLVKGLVVLCGLQIVFTLVSACLAVTSNEPQAAKIQNGMIGFVSFFVGFLGIFGAAKKHKNALVLFITIELWGLSSITTYLFNSVKAHNAVTLMCKDFALGAKASVANAKTVGAATVVDCDVGTGKFVAICLLCLLSLAAILLGAYFGFRLSEVIERPPPPGATASSVDPAAVPLLMTDAEFDAADVDHDGALSKKELHDANEAKEAKEEGDGNLPNMGAMMELSVEQMVNAMKVLCFLQVGASFVSFVVNLNDKQNTDAVSMGQSVFASVTGLITGVAGVYGAAKRDRGALTFFFVVEMWVLSTMTTYLFSSMLNASDGSLMCSTLTVKGQNCAGVAAVGTLRIMLAFGLCVNSVTAAYFSWNLSEAIQDEQEEEAQTKAAKSS